MTDVAFGIQPVPEHTGVKGGRIIGPGVAHEDGDGGDQTAGAGHGVQVPQSGVPPGGISLPPGGIIGAVCFAVVGCRPSRPGQGGGEKAQRQNQGQDTGKGSFLFHGGVPPLHEVGRGNLSHQYYIDLPKCPDNPGIFQNLASKGQKTPRISPKD